MAGVAASGRLSSVDPLVACLAAGCTVKEAAATVGIGERTAYRKLAAAGFRSRVLAQRAAMADRLIGRLIERGDQAISVLSALLEPDNPPAVRLSAAVKVLEIGGRLREQADTEERIRALEVIANEGY